MNFELNLKRVLSLLIIVVISFILVFPFSTVVESDNTLHITFADIYRQNGINFSDFKWQTNSIFSVYKSDMWYGFHLLLIPFIVGSNYMFSVQLATFFLSSTFLILFFLFLEKLKVKQSLLWTLLFLFSSSTEIYRIFNLRPHVIILSLCILLTYFLVWERNRKAIFFTSVLFTFVEVSMLWIPLGFLFLSFVSNGLVDLYRKVEFRKVFETYFYDFLIILSGLILGSFMRPNPVAGLKLFYYQIVYLYYVKLSGVALPWGIELYRLNHNFTPSFLGVFAILLVTITFYLINNKPFISVSNERLMRFSLVGSGFFGLILVFISARGSDLFMLFTFIAAALIFSQCSDIVPASIRDNFWANFLLKTAILLVFYSSIFTFTFFRYQYGQRIDLYRNTAVFLENNTPKDSVVGYVFFDELPDLFIWNKHNYYFGHSDPIFQYTYNPKVYTEFICSLVKLDKNEDHFNEYFYNDYDQESCLSRENDLASILKNDMKVDYFYINSAKQFFWVRYFMRNKNVTLIYSDDYSIVFKLN